MSSANRLREYLNVDAVLEGSLNPDNAADFFVVDWDGEVVKLSCYSDSKDEWRDVPLSEVATEHNLTVASLEDYCVVDLWLNNNLDKIFEHTDNYRGFSFSESEGAELIMYDGTTKVKTFDDVVDAFESMPKDEWTFEECHRLIRLVDED